MFRNHPDQSRALKSRVKILFRSFSIEINLFKLQMKKKYICLRIFHYRSLTSSDFSQQIEIQIKYECDIKWPLLHV